MKPTKDNMLFLKHILRYLSGRHDHAILYQQTDGDALAAFADADYAVSSDLRSITGHIHISFGAPVAWSSKNQSTSYLNKFNAEHLVASHTLPEILCLRRMLDTSNP